MSPTRCVFVGKECLLLCGVSDDRCIGLSFVRWLFCGCAIGLLVVWFVPLVLSFLATPGLCRFLRGTPTRSRSLAMHGFGHHQHGHAWVPSVCALDSSSFRLPSRLPGRTTYASTSNPTWIHPRSEIMLPEIAWYLRAARLGPGKPQRLRLMNSCMRQVPTQRSVCYTEKAEQGQQHPGNKTAITPADYNRKKQCRPNDTKPNSNWMGACPSQHQQRQPHTPPPRPRQHAPQLPPHSQRGHQRGDLLASFLGRPIVMEVCDTPTRSLSCCGGGMDDRGARGNRVCTQAEQIGLHQHWCLPYGAV